MSSEAPILHKIPDIHVLPNWSDRFARNVNITSFRKLRDLREDAFQGHWDRVYSTLLTINGIKIQSGNINSGTDELGKILGPYMRDILEKPNIISRRCQLCSTCCQ